VQLEAIFQQRLDDLGRPGPDRFAPVIGHVASARSDQFVGYLAHYQRDDRVTDFYNFLTFFLSPETTSSDYRSLTLMSKEVIRSEVL
jgi:hypothetical protein